MSLSHFQLLQLYFALQFGAAFEMTRCPWASISPPPHPNVVSKQPRKLYHNYTPDIDLSRFILVSTAPHPHPCILSLNLFVSFIPQILVHFCFSLPVLSPLRDKQETSKCGFVVIVIQSYTLRRLAAYGVENPGARQCADAYCYDNGTYVWWTPSVVDASSVADRYCGDVMSPSDLSHHQGIV